MVIRHGAIAGDAHNDGKRLTVCQTPLKPGLALVKADADGRDRKCLLASLELSVYMGRGRR